MQEFQLKGANCIGSNTRKIRACENSQGKDLIYNFTIRILFPPSSKHHLSFFKSYISSADL